MYNSDNNTNLPSYDPDVIAETAKKMAASALAELRNDRVEFRKRIDKDPEWLNTTGKSVATGLVYNAADLVKQGGDVGLSLLSYLCQRVAPDADPEVRSETYGTEVRIIVSVAGTYVGTVSRTYTGGERACLLKAPFTFGTSTSINGALAARWLCDNPDHRAAEGVDL